TPRPGDPTGIWVYDGNLRRLTRVVPGPAAGTPAIISGLARIPGGGTVALRMLWLTHDRILFIGFSDTNRIMFADSLGHVTDEHPGPLLGASVVPKDIREDGSTGTIVCPKPSGDRFAIAYVDAARIDMFDDKGLRLPGAKVLFPSDSERAYFEDSEGQSHNPNPRGYYTACFATTDRIYALFSGRLATEGPPGSHKWDAQYVHVFDWSGKLVSVLKLDRLANAIAVSGDSVLYAGGAVTTGIYRYRLPPSIASGRPH
ncbi:MAG: BF3164 family lipoprotein, partial [Gemmatimonadales bacterium]